MRQSKLFSKTIKNISAEEKSLNAQLLIKGGFINKEMAGIYSYLPLGWRVIEKISKIVRQEINALGGQEILMPALQPKANWRRTDRWEAMDVLFKLKGSGNKEYALGATHEEIITPLVDKFIDSYKDLPLYAYQIQIKFRDEPRAKSGLLRGREFLMKDLYSFHADEKDLENYYEKIQTAYANIYKKVGIGEKTYFTFAGGGIFSKYSHEYQTITKNGEDIIFICDNCRLAVNKEIVEEEQKNRAFCPECDNKKLRKEKSIEVGNIFKLKTKFSKAFDLKYLNKEGQERPVLMGCYGIGISRLLGAVVEVFNDKKGIIWPPSIAPFTCHLLTLGPNPPLVKKSDLLYNKLLEAGIEVLYDERDERAGFKFADADLLGIPWRIVISEKALAKDSAELKRRDSEQVKLVKLDKIISMIKDN